MPVELGDKIDEVDSSHAASEIAVQHILLTPQCKHDVSVKQVQHTHHAAEVHLPNAYTVAALKNTYTLGCRLVPCPNGTTSQGRVDLNGPCYGVNTRLSSVAAFVYQIVA